MSAVISQNIEEIHDSVDCPFNFLENLPAELILEIAGYLDVVEDYVNLRQCSKTLASVIPPPKLKVMIVTRMNHGHIGKMRIHVPSSDELGLKG